MLHDRQGGKEKNVAWINECKQVTSLCVTGPVEALQPSGGPGLQLFLLSSFSLVIFFPFLSSGFYFCFYFGRCMILAGPQPVSIAFSPR